MRKNAVMGWVVVTALWAGATVSCGTSDGSDPHSSDDAGTGSTGDGAVSASGSSGGGTTSSSGGSSRGGSSGSGGVSSSSGGTATRDAGTVREGGAGLDAAAGADACSPRCNGKTCGSDGCGGSCGTCASGTCGAGGTCAGGTRDAAVGPDTCPSGSPNCGLHVVRGTGGAMGHIVNGAGNVVQIHGVNVGGTEYQCAYGSVYRDYTPGQAAITTLKGYHVNAIRIPLNEQCWLGVNGLPTISGGAASYRQQITDLVNLLTSNGLVSILDLHIASPGTMQGTAFEIQMADMDHSTTFWSQLGTAFKNNSSVIFDLYNEPNGNLTWSCWGNGCAMTTSCSAGTCGAVSYQVAGMTQLIAAVRGSGSQNVAMMAGMGFSSDFSQWVANVPADPNVVASWHMYDDIIGCPSCPSATQTETTDSINGVLAAGYPVIFSETGISAVTAPPAASKTWLNGMLTLLETQGQGYTAYEWGLPGDDPALLSSVSSDGATVALTAYGTVYTTHLAALP